MEASELTQGQCKYCGAEGYIADTDCGGVMIDGEETLPEDGGDFLLGDARNGRPVCDECANGREWVVVAQDWPGEVVGGGTKETFKIYCGVDELSGEITETLEKWVASGDYADGCKVRVTWFAFLDLDPDADEYHDTGMSGEETFVYDAAEGESDDE